MLRLLFTITVVVLFSSVIIAQGEKSIEIRGEVKDSLYLKPLAFAHVRIKGKTTGVPTNSEGKFALPIPKEAASDSLVISLIGYLSKIVPIKTLSENDSHIFLLQENSFHLDEVVIEAKSAENIIREVASRLKDNFPVAPFEFEGYYRNSYSESDKYVRQFETAFAGYDGNYHNRSGHSVKMLKQKESPDYRRFKWRQSQGNIPWHYLWRTRRQQHHFFTGKQYLQYDYSLDDITYLDEEEVYKINFILKDRSDRIRESWAFIRAKDYAILEIGGNWNIVNPKKIQLSDSLSMAYIGGTTSVRYVEYQGKMYPSYSSSLHKHEAYDAQANRLGSFDMNEEMIIHLILAPTDYRSKRDFEQAQQTKILALPTDSVFWKQYNKPVETALSKAIRRDLEQHRKSIEDL